MPSHALVFAAEHIQRFIAASGLLRDLAGASELLENLWGGVLDHCVAAVDPQGQTLRFSRRAGGAFYVFAEQPEILDRLQQLWTLVVQQYAPGLGYSLARGCSKNAQDGLGLHSDYLAFREAMHALRAAQSRILPVLPAATPFTSRSRRTGHVATHHTQRRKRLELVDATMWRARKMNNAGALGKRCLPEAFRKNYVWPTLFESDSEDVDDRFIFPWASTDQRQIAFIHADGNGMGRLLKSISEQLQGSGKDFVGEFLRFSQIIGEITQLAVQKATVEILFPKARSIPGRDLQVLPARPIVVGGDDLSIIVRADLALDFTECFLQAFSRYSEQRLADLPLSLDIQRLSACAGIAYIHSSQPFELAHNLAESLCDHAKKQAKAQNSENIPATISFYRVTTSLVDDFDQLLEREASITRLGEILRNTMESYFLDDLPEVPNLSDLKKLLRDMGSGGPLQGGTSRELLGLVTQAPEQAERHYIRWKEVVQEKNPQAWNSFRDLLHKLAGAPEKEDLPFGKYAPQHEQGGRKLRRSPLGDIHTLLAVAAR